jgi:hypothetical protein
VETQAPDAVTRAVAFALLLALAACSRDRVDAPAAAPVATAPAPSPPAPPPPPAPAPPVTLAPDASALPREDRDYLVARGLVNPEAELIADLRAHPELIPCKGEVGGTPGFHDPEAIRILARDHVEAGFDDGHAGGTVELQYKVSGGRIAWKVKHAQCPGADAVAATVKR